MMSGHVEYQILVVTRLAAFKSAKHRPEDVVQFLVSRRLWPGCFEGARGPGGQTHLPTRVQVASGAGASLSVACSGPGVPDRARQKGHGVNQTLAVHGEADL